ncbi:MAG TPA: dihydrodipicolinate synthase family protein [Devosiaceae bacterium]|jgi:4-hydroxy-tetrahydrodipicolinate synthase
MSVHSAERAQPHILDGVTVPLVTPLTADRVPDAKLVVPLLDSLKRSGIDTLMLLGTNGEGATLDGPDAVRFATEAAQAWRDIRGAGAKVLIATFGAGTAHLMASARSMLAARPDAIVVAPPHYFVHTERELLAHFRATADLGLPIIAYNIPRYSGNPITPALLEQLFALDHIVGMKDSGGGEELIDLGIRLQNQSRRFGISQGNEKLLGWALLRGARGITPGVGNLAPALSSAIVAAANAGNVAEVERLQTLLTGFTTIHTVRPGVPAMKAALSLLGLCTPTPGAPFEAYSADENGRLWAILDARREGLAAPLRPLGSA